MYGAVVGVAEAVSGGPGEVVAVAERDPEPICCTGTTIVIGVGAALLPPPNDPPLGTKPFGASLTSQSVRFAPLETDPVMTSR